MKVLFGTVALLLAIVVAVFGYAASDGESDLIVKVLIFAGILILIAFGLLGWSVIDWSRRVKVTSEGDAAANHARVSGGFSTAVLVLGIVIAFVNFPRFIDWVTQSGMYDPRYRQLLSPFTNKLEQLPWAFAFGCLVIALAVMGKIRTRRSRR